MRHREAGGDARCSAVLIFVSLPDGDLGPVPRPCPNAAATTRSKP